MEKMINELCQRTGIDRATAEKVVTYMKENANRIPELLGSGDGSKGMAGRMGEVVGRRT